MKQVKKGLLLILSIALLFTTSFSNKTEVKAETTLEKLQKAKEEKAKTESNKTDAEKEKENLTITQNSLLGKLSSLNDDLQDISDSLQDTEDRIADKEETIENTQLELEEAIETEERQYQEMKARVKYMYESGNVGYLELLLSAKSFSDFLNKSDYVEQLSKYDRQTLEKYKEAREYVEEVKTQLEVEMADLEDLKADYSEQQQQVSAKVTQTSNEVADYADQIEDAEETIAELEKEIADQEEDIAALQKQYEEELALSRLAQQSAWRDISEITFEEDDRYLLANLIYCEAGGEPYAGQLAVGAVVINRVLSSRYPNTVVGVIYQNKQFSPVASGRLALALANNKATANCYKAADEAMSGVTNVGQCLYFRTPIPGLTGISIGGHIFY